MLTVLTAVPLFFPAFLIGTGFVLKKKDFNYAHFGYKFEYGYRFKYLDFTTNTDNGIALHP